MVGKDALETPKEVAEPNSPLRELAREGALRRLRAAFSEGRRDDPLPPVGGRGLARAVQTNVDSAPRSGGLRRCRAPPDPSTRNAPGWHPGRFRIFRKGNDTHAFSTRNRG